MKINGFEDLIVWQKSQDLAVIIYSSFENIKDFGFVNQITRASVSISNNIAEGYDRNSTKEYSRFLKIALGSNSEVRSMLYLSKRLKLISDENFQTTLNLTIEISKMIRAIIKKLDS